MSDGFSTAARAVTEAALLLVGIYIYLALVRQIFRRYATQPSTNEPTFGLADVILALFLGTLFILNFTVGVSHNEAPIVLKNSDLIFNGLMEGGVFIFIVAFLQLRGRSVNSLGGFSRIGFLRTLVTGAILLIAAYPFILLAELATQRLLGDLPKQGIVELFTNSQSLVQRALIIFLATAVAPVVEEFVFRFFLYGVLRRYIGPLAGLLVNAALFAAVHAHLPSTAQLFVLGVCFTLAYEWSGSILVPMTMHSLFNAVSLVALAFPDSLAQ